VTLFRRSHDIEVSISPMFDKEYEPEGTPIHSGIYRCRGCGYEIIAGADMPLPPPKHHRHSPAQGPIRWRLAVAVEQGPH
jgi:hypothetical protein